MFNKNPPIIQYKIQWKSSTGFWSNFDKIYTFLIKSTNYPVQNPVDNKIQYKIQ